jgi:aminopeptidase
MSIITKYADLLTHYCLQVKKGHKVYINSSYLAEPLLQELQRSILQAGGIPVFNITFSEQSRIHLEFGEKDQLEFIAPTQREAFTSYDAFLSIQSPFNLKADMNADSEKRNIVSNATKELMKVYSQRTADGSMRRNLCLYPTQASAQEAGMSLSEYEKFVFDACNLYEDDPIAAWQEVGRNQQKATDYLNKSKNIHYKGPNIDIKFNTEGRTWINSDGKSNMPSGEVFTAPVDNSVNGKVKFTYPSIYMGNEVHDVELEVKDGEVISWYASQGKAFLDKIFEIPGARFFGEAAVGTNYKIQKMTKNILFDEKIGGTIHMAIGQAYIQCGGKNESTVHWDMITDMTQGGEIWADDVMIYQNGKFII